MEQITLVFLIGAFVLFLLQLKYRKEYSLKVLGFFASVSLVALSLMDAELTTNSGSLAIMLGSGFALTIYTLLGMVRQV